MTHRSPYHMFVKPVLAALAIAAGATLAAPVGGLDVLAAMEPAPQETIVPVAAPVGAKAGLAAPEPAPEQATAAEHSLPGAQVQRVAAPIVDQVAATGLRYGGLSVTEAACLMGPLKGGMPQDCTAEWIVVGLEAGLCLVSTGVLGIKLYRLWKRLEKALKLDDLSVVDAALLAASGFLCGTLLVGVIDLIHCIWGDDGGDHVDEVLVHRLFFDEHTGVVLAVST